MSKVGNFLYIAGAEALDTVSNEVSALYRYDLTNPGNPAVLVNNFTSLQGDQGNYTIWMVVGLSLDFDGNLVVLASGRGGTRPIIFLVDPSTGEIIEGSYGGDDYLSLSPRDADDGTLKVRDHESLAISSCDGRVYASLGVTGTPSGPNSADFFSEIDLTSGEYNIIRAIPNNDTDGLSFGGEENSLYASNGTIIFSVDESTGNLTQLDNLIGMGQGSSALDLKGLDFEIVRPPIVFNDDVMISCSQNATLDIFANDDDPNSLLDYSTLTFTNVPSYYTVSTNGPNTQVNIDQTAPSPNTVDEITYTVVSQSFGCLDERTLEGTIRLQSACLLPIELSNFSVARQDNDALLSWTTLTETNNDYFELEYSLTGSNFEPLTTVDGAGNSTEQLSYTFTHENVTSLPTSIIYYRLAQIDFDGTRTASDIIALAIGLDSSISVAPVPTKRGQLVTITGQNLSNYRLYNSWGQLVKFREFPIGQSAIVIQISELHSGVYFLQPNDGKTLKLVIQ